jgi:tetratricopeptide (TPR) repeat protein
MSLILRLALPCDIVDVDTTPTGVVENGGFVNVITVKDNESHGWSSPFLTYMGFPSAHPGQGQFLQGRFRAFGSRIKDRDPQIRTYAVAGLEFSEAKSRLVLVTPLLDDPVRAVRNEAARVLASVPESLWECQQREKWDKALREYEEVQRAAADRPESHMNLANLYNQLGCNQEAEPLLRKMIEFYQGLGGDDYQSELGELNYSMGLLLSEMNRLQEAVDYLHQASQIMNERARVQYNYGLALQHLQRYPDAERALIKAQRLEPDEPRFVHALVIIHLQQNQWKKALPYAKRLVELSEDPAAKELLGYIQNQIEERWALREFNAR